MFIVHVVTLISPTGAYGGPVRVALNQLSELKKRGHDVLLVAGHSGFQGAPPTQIEGVDVALFDVRRFTRRSAFGTLYSPRLMRYLFSISGRADVFHLHFARDFVMMPAGAVIALLRKPFVVQSHGMLSRSSRPIIKMLDLVGVSPVIRRSRRLFFLTPFEREELEALYPTMTERLRYLPNGVPEPESINRKPTSPVFLFLARFHSRKNPLLFVQAAVRRLNQGSKARFVLAGPDEGELAQCLNEISRAEAGDRISYEGTLDYSATAELMRRSSVLVLPSVSEPFPMSVLEGLSYGLPAVITGSNGLAKSIRAANAGIVTQPSVDSVTAALERLENENGLLANLSENALALASSEFSIRKVVTDLEDDYEVLTTQNGVRVNRAN